MMVAEHTANEGITITQNSVIRFVLTNKYVQHVVNLLTVALFFYAIYRAAVGPTDSGRISGTSRFSVSGGHQSCCSVWCFLGGSGVTFVR
jgi:hypothetical protein